MPDPDIMKAYDEWVRKNRTPPMPPGGTVPGVAVATSPPAVATPSSQVDPDIIEAYDKRERENRAPIATAERKRTPREQAFDDVLRLQHVVEPYVPPPGLARDRRGGGFLGGGAANVSVASGLSGGLGKLQDLQQRHVSDPISATMTSLAPPRIPGPEVPFFEQKVGERDLTKIHRDQLLRRFTLTRYEALRSRAA